MLRTCLTMGLLLMLGAPLAAQTLDRLKPMRLATPLDERGRPSAVIVAGPQHRDVAEALAARIKKVTGLALRVTDDARLGRDGHVIALGHFGNNRLLERLYDQYHVVVDGLQPGAGGYLLQTVHNPGNRGANVIVVGGSDDAGVQRAADRLVEVIRAHGPTLPRLWEVELGFGKEAVRARCAAVLAPDRAWPDSHFMEIQQAIAEAGMLYVYTGDERLAEVYKRQLRRMLERSDLSGISDDFDFTIVVWDLLEEAPVFSDEERFWITRRLWEVMRFIRTDQEVNFTNWKTALSATEPRANHQARYAGSLYFGARYFRDYYQMPETKAWLEEVEAYWRPQMHAVAVREGAHPLAHITQIKAMDYALAEGVDTFLSEDVLGRLAEKELIRTRGATWLPHDTAFQPRVFWAAAAHRLGQSKYLRPLAQTDPPMIRLRIPWEGTWSITRSYWDGTLPDLERSHVERWVNTIPLDRAYYDNTQTYGPKNVPHADAFESLVIQDPALRGDQYLALGGMSLGYTGTDGANAIQYLYLAGQRWLWGGGDVGGRIATVPKHSSLAVVRDGVLAPVPAYAKLLAMHSTPEWGAARTSLSDYGETDWVRSIVNVPDQWFLVIDEVAARQGGDYLLESRWVGHEHAYLDEADVVFPRGGQHLRMTGVGFQSQYVRPWLYSDYLQAEPAPLPRRKSFRPVDSPAFSVQVARRWSGRLAQGQTHTFANLLAVESADAGRHRLVKLDEDRYRVEGPADRWRVVRRDDGGWSVEHVEADAPSTKIAASPAEPSPAMGDELTPTWQSELPSVVLSAVAVRRSEGDHLWAVGLRSGAVQLLDAQGRQVGTMQVEGQVFALAAIDLDQDGQQEVVAGTDAGHVVAFDLAGRRRAAWEAPAWTPQPNYRQMFGTWRNLVTELHPLELDGRPALLAAGTYFTVLDAALKPVAAYNTEQELDITDLPGNAFKNGLWRTAERTLVMTAADVDGDGTPEIAGDDPAVQKLRVWNPQTAQRLHAYDRPADRFQGSAKKCITAGDLDGDGRDELIVGFDAFNQQLVVYEHPYTSGWRWSARLSGACEAVALADLERGRGRAVLAATELGQLQAFDASGRRLFVADTGAAVGSTAALAAVGKGERCRVWVATVNGRVGVYSAAGKPIAEGTISGYGAHVVPAPDGATVLVTSVNGAVQCYDALAASR